MKKLLKYLMLADFWQAIGCAYVRELYRQDGWNPLEEQPSLF
jgi:hypothetical protein